jgi:oligopeptide/dipeptide ABC transporter ATP-binding protein
MALLLITHDLGIVAQMAHRVAVMYAGEIVEQAPVDSIFHATSHPYTIGLRRALPDPAARGSLRAIEGAPPNLAQPPAGCGFYARCEQARKVCAVGAVPAFAVSEAHCSRCWLLHPQLAATGVAPGREIARDES